MAKKSVRWQIALYVGIAAILVYGLPYYEEALFTLILSILLAYIILPGVRLLERGKLLKLKLKISRPIAILIMYLLVGGSFVLLLGYGIPPLLNQTQKLAKATPEYFQHLQQFVETLKQKYHAIPFPENVESALEEQFTHIIGELANTLKKTVTASFMRLSSLLEIAMIPIITFYLLIDLEKLRRGFYKFFPRSWKSALDFLMGSWGRCLNNYIKVQILLALLMFFVATLFFLILGFDVAIILGLIAGITKAIPIIGAFLGAAPALLVALINPDPGKHAMLVVIFFTAVYIIENKIILPKLMEKYVDVHAVTVLFSILVGGKVAGLWGMFLAVPVASMTKILYLFILRTYLEPEQASKGET